MLLRRGELDLGGFDRVTHDRGNIRLRQSPSGNFLCSSVRRSLLRLMLASLRACRRRQRAALTERIPGLSGAHSALAPTALMNARRSQRS